MASLSRRLSTSMFMSASTVPSQTNISSLFVAGALTDASAIRHPIVREAIKLHHLAPLEIVSLADIPAGTGLGSSGYFHGQSVAGNLRL